MSRLLCAEELWRAGSKRSVQRLFEPSQMSALPEAARLYLSHAIARGTPLASAVRLKMHGEIKIKHWRPFSASEVILVGRGMIWEASTRIFSIPVRGSDRLLDREGRMQWKLFGLLPFIQASGVDITRSAAGRVNIESVWLPSVLCSEDVAWAALPAHHLRAEFNADVETAVLDLKLGKKGELEEVSTSRWGNPDQAGFRYCPFGAYVEQEAVFGGYTIPSRMRIGWFFGSERFDREGEFFRVTIDEAMFR